MTSQKRAIGLVAVVLFVGSMMAHGADFDFASGVKAYDRGDYATALRIFRQLADQGAAEAQSYLGFIYDKGQGVGQDYKEAIKWYRKAADQGYARAQYNLGLMYLNGQGVPRDYVQAHMWYNLAAAQGEDFKYAREARDNIAKRMTAEQIAEAQKLAREWKPKGK